MKQRRHTFWLALSAFVFCAALPAGIPTALPATVPASTPRLNFETGVCAELADTLEPPRSWIPGGCETPLCCIGCPDAAIDWHIRVSGEPIESTLLQFENLSPEAKRKLRIKGRARWEGSALRVWPGETVVSGFSHDPRAVPTIATPRLFGNRESLKRLQQTAEREEAKRAGTAEQRATPDDARPLGRMEVSIEQMMGKYPVSEARVAYNVKACPRRPINTDHISVNFNNNRDNTVVLLDARDGNGCFSDRPYRGSEIVSLGDIRSNGGCRSEVAVFSDDNAMLFIPQVNSWTDLGLDNLTADLKPLLHAPVSVWIATNVSGRPEGAEWEIATANMLYNNNNAGIAFDATYHFVADNADAVKAISTPSSSKCPDLSRIRNSGFYTLNQLNVYYVDWADTGINCFANGVGDPNITFIGLGANFESLAHEFGHAFSLDHTNFATVSAGFTNVNVMWPFVARVARTHISEGQAFRMNMNGTSALNRNLVRIGPIRAPDCLDTMDNDICPRLALDVTPK
jgi:hypothetical protein